MRSEDRSGWQPAGISKCNINWCNFGSNITEMVHVGLIDFLSWQQRLNLTIFIELKTTRQLRCSLTLYHRSVETLSGLFAYESSFLSIRIMFLYFFFSACTFSFRVTIVARNGYVNSTPIIAPAGRFHLPSSTDLRLPWCLRVLCAIYLQNVVAIQVSANHQ